MLGRVTVLFLLLGAEVLAASLAFDGAYLAVGGGGLVALLQGWGAWAARWAVAAMLLYGGFAFVQGRSVPAAARGGFLRAGWLAAHVAALGGFATLSASIYGGGIGSGFAVILWAALAGAVAVTAGFTVLPPGAWLALFRETGWLWLTASGAAALACAVGAVGRSFWQPITSLTFALVRFLLGHAVQNLVVEPERALIGTSKFTVIISPECSGLEGMGLMLAFGLLWLTLFRDELRFPHALVVLPAGIAVLYLLNAARIVALILLGDAGWREVAVRGFHSQAGWIAFSLVALAILLFSRRLAWLAAKPLPAAAVEYPAAPYLVPFLAIVGAGIVSQAMTAEFEWFYGLRLAGAAVALWLFRGRYRGIEWRCGWPAAGAGLVVFLLWIAADRLVHGSMAGAGMPPELAQASVGARLAWLTFRIAGAVLAAPVAEELAFRGFGLRALLAADFERVPWQSWNWLAVGGSSILFGCLHGGLWFAGIAAGAIYAWAMARRGRLGDAIAAHATTNGLLAIYVLSTGRWNLW